MATLVAEADATAPGDAITLSVYLIEPGASSERVLGALRAAARRGVRVSIFLDGTVASWLSRAWERTGTLWPLLRALAEEHPGLVRATRRRVPDHSKYAIFERTGAPSSAVIGGMNLGDRFRAWRDFALVVSGRAAVGSLVRRLGGASEAPVGLAGGSLAFVVNAPERASFEVEPALVALATDRRLVLLRAAVSYLDGAGARVLELALARGAAVDLVLPRAANVYEHANRRALARLLRAGGRFRAALCPEPLHAKVVLALDAGGQGTAFVGSANLKRNSFRFFGELDALVHGGLVAGALERELARLVAASEPVTGPRPFGRFRAYVEECLG